MFINSQEKGSVAKFGSVSVEIHYGSYRLRFRVAKERYSITLGRADSEQAFKAACAKAQEINSDILMERFDTSLVKYDPKRAQKLAPVTPQTKLNIKDCWERYKQSNKEKVCQTSQKNGWKDLDRMLSKLSTEALELSNSEQFLKELLSLYSVGTLKRVLTNINAALNSALKAKLISENPLANWRDELPKQQKMINQRPQAWTPKEVQCIVNAFKDDQFNKPKSAYAHSYYAGYVTFLALTGCRPEEAIALTWNDIKHSSNGVQIVINKAFSKGILLPHTKNRLARIIPCNNQLIKLLNSIPRNEKSDLVFPAPKGGYIDQHNFQTRIFKPIINALHSEGKISKVLTTYHLRHSFATRLVRSGMDVSAVAGLIGDNVATVIKYYLGVDTENTKLPEL